MLPAEVFHGVFVASHSSTFSSLFNKIISATTFDKGLLDGFLPYNVIFALEKSYTFAFIIASIPAFYGYYVKGGALEIGQASTKSVVVSCILILFADYILSALLLPS